MKLLETRESGVLVELSRTEIGVLCDAVIEFSQGAYAPTDEQWERLNIGTRRANLELAEELMSLASDDSTP